MLNFIMLSVMSFMLSVINAECQYAVMLSIVMLSVIYAECHNAECCSAEC